MRGLAFQLSEFCFSANSQSTCFISLTINCNVLNIASKMPKHCVILTDLHVATCKCYVLSRRFLSPVT